MFQLWVCMSRHLNSFRLGQLNSPTCKIWSSRHLQNLCVTSMLGVQRNCEDELECLITNWHQVEMCVLSKLGCLLASWGQVRVSVYVFLKSFGCTVYELAIARPYYLLLPVLLAIGNVRLNLKAAENFK